MSSLCSELIRKIRKEKYNNHPGELYLSIASVYDDAELEEPCLSIKDGLAILEELDKKGFEYDSELASIYFYIVASTVSTWEYVSHPIDKFPGFKLAVMEFGNGGIEPESSEKKEFLIKRNIGIINDDPEYIFADWERCYDPKDFSEDI